MAKKRPAGELVIPPSALTDKHSVEMLRVWIAANQLHCSLKIGHWENHRGGGEDRAWGMVLADVVRHISNAIHVSDGTDRAETAGRIIKALEVELSDPTTKHRGRFVEPEPDSRA